MRTIEVQANATVGQTATRPQRLGDILVAMEAVSRERLEEALSAQRRRPGSRIGRLLDLDEDTLTRALASQYALPWAKESPAPAAELLHLVPRELLLSASALPLRCERGELHVALADPTDPALLERISVHSGLPVHATVVPAAALRAALNQAGDATLTATAGQGALDAIPADADRLEVDAGLEAITEESLRDERFPVARLLNALLFAAVREGASDVHIEPRSGGVQVKLRIDGALVTRLSGLRMGLLAPLVSRVKVLARLDVAETRVPQDGRFRVWVAGREVDFRVAILPTILGESAVIRVLDRKSTLLSLRTIGFEAEELSRFRGEVSAPYGMVLVSGPTGSGKTTTLYAAIREVYREGDKWITIEEPVEYQLDGVMQIPVNPKNGVTFAQGLRAIVRQDPDRLMVGEIRDRETAEIAVNAALTGHLVLSTIHANNVLDTLGRLQHLGLEPYQLASALNLVMAQRLLRKLCVNCRQETRVTGEALSSFGLTEQRLGAEAHFVAVGCEQCGWTGYRGRRPIFEILPMSDSIRELLLARASILTIRQQARMEGMRELRSRALELVRAGETSLEEMARVTREG